MMQTVLIIEDDARIANWIKVYFEREGIKADIAHDGELGLALAKKNSYDLLVLDLMLPKLSGEAVCKEVRLESDVPIIMLTAKGTYHEQVKGLDVGADDYIVKPFDPNVLLARARAVLRRYQGKRKKVFSCGKLSLDETCQDVYLGQEYLNLSSAQFALLAAFMRHPKQVLSREQLIRLAFDDFYAFDRAIDTHIKRLRKLIHTDDFQPIQTVYGAGYKFVCEAC